MYWNILTVVNIYKVNTTQIEQKVFQQSSQNEILKNFLSLQMLSFSRDTFSDWSYDANVTNVYGTCTWKLVATSLALFKLLAWIITLASQTMFSCCSETHTDMFVWLLILIYKNRKAKDE